MIEPNDERGFRARLHRATRHVGVSSVDRALLVLLAVLSLAYGTLILWAVTTGRDSYAAGVLQNRQVTIDQSAQNRAIGQANHDNLVRICKALKVENCQ